MKDLLNLVPQGNIVYPVELQKKQRILIQKFQACKNEINLLQKLTLITHAFQLFSDQMSFEHVNKVKAMAVLEKDRLIRQGRVLPNGREME